MFFGMNTTCVFILQLIYLLCADGLKVAVTRRENLSDQLKIISNDVNICSRFNAQFDYKDSEHIYCNCEDNQVFYSPDKYETPRCHRHNYAKKSKCMCEEKNCIGSLAKNKLTLTKPIINKLCGDTRLSGIEYWDGRTWTKFWASGISLNVSYVNNFQYPFLNFYMTDPYVYYAGHLLRFDVKCRVYGIDAVESCLIARGVGTFIYENIKDPIIDISSSTSLPTPTSSSSSSKAVTVAVCCVAVIALVALGTWLIYRHLSRRDKESQDTHQNQTAYVNYNCKEEQRTTTPPTYFMNIAQDQNREDYSQYQHSLSRGSAGPQFDQSQHTYPHYNSSLSRAVRGSELGEYVYPDNNTLSRSSDFIDKNESQYPNYQIEYSGTSYPYPYTIQPAATVASRI